MSLELAFKRLAIRPLKFCHKGHRSFTSSAQQCQQQSATAGLAESLNISQMQRTAEAQRRTPRPAASATRSATATSSNRSYEMARGAIISATGPARERKRAQELADIERQFTRRDLEQQMVRRFKPGDVYAPHDLSGAEMAKWKKIRRKPKSKYDVLDQLKLNPLEHYKNFSIMSEYITPMGRIRHSNDTGLRPVNQRKMAKAIRRAMGMGLMPGVHRHPEIIRAEERDRRSSEGYY